VLQVATLTDNNELHVKIAW